MMRALASSSHVSAARVGVSIRRNTAANATMVTPTSTKTQSLAAAARLALLPRQKHHHFHSLRCPPCAAGAPSQPGRKRGPGEEGSEAEALQAAAESSADAPAKKADESPSSSSEAASGSDSDDSAAAAAAAAREQQAAARAASAGADTPGGGLSPADLARLRAARAADKGGGGASSSSSSGAGIGSGFFGDVLAEAKLIEWPSLKQALGDTVLVVGIVLGSALLLFVVNTLLADLSKVIY